jgi:hypothetical protein
LFVVAWFTYQLHAFTALKDTNQENINIEIRRDKFRWIGHTLRNNDRELTRLQKERKVKGQLEEKHINRSWEKSWRELRPIARDRRE